MRAGPDGDGGRSRGLYSFGASVLEGVGVWVYGVCVWCLMFETMLRLRYYARWVMSDEEPSFRFYFSKYLRYRRREGR